MTSKPEDDASQSASRQPKASEHQDNCRCQHNPPGTNYYVSAIEDRRYVLLAGPFDNHPEACNWVERARDQACRVDPRAWFYAYGTTAMKPQYLKPGILNDQLGLGGER